MSGTGSPIRRAGAVALASAVAGAFVAGVEPDATVSGDDEGDTGDGDDDAGAASGDDEGDTGGGEEDEDGDDEDDDGDAGTDGAGAASGDDKDGDDAGAAGAGAASGDDKDGDDDDGGAGSPARSATENRRSSQGARETMGRAVPWSSRRRRRSARPEVSVGRLVAGLVVLAGSLGLAFATAGLWVVVNEVCDGVGRVDRVLRELGQVRSCELAFVDSLVEPSPDTFVFDVVGARAAGRVLVRSSWGGGDDLDLVERATLLTRGETFVLDELAARRPSLVPRSTLELR